MLRLGPGVRLALALVALALALPTAVGPWLVEPRRLAMHLGRPPVALPETPAGDLAGYLSDRVAGRIEAAALLARLRFDLLGDAASPLLVRNGAFVFLASHGPTPLRPMIAIEGTCQPPDSALYPGWPARLTADTRAIHARLTAAGWPVAFLIVPSKRTLYPERLPTAVPAAVRRACARAAAAGNFLDGWARGARAQGIVAVHPHALLRRHRERPGFYPPENFHADGASAHYAAWALLARLFPGAYRPGAVAMAPGPVAADLAHVLGFEYRPTALVPDYGARTPRRPWRAEARAHGALPPGIPRGAVRRLALPGGEGRLLILGDSFVRTLAPHLAVAFAETMGLETTLLPRPDRGAAAAAALAFFNPTQVVVLVHDARAKEEGLAAVMGLAGAIPPAAPPLPAPAPPAR